MPATSGEMGRRGAIVTGTIGSVWAASLEAVGGEAAITNSTVPTLLLSSPYPEKAGPKSRLSHPSKCTKQAYLELK